MNKRLVVGAGLIGRPLAERLAARGDTVTIATRSGSTVVGTTALVLDASDPAAFTYAATDASTIFLCTNPPYTDQATQWPPIYAAAIAAASATGARIVVMGNLYPHGSPTGAMTEHSPETTTESKGLIRQTGWAKMRASSYQFMVPYVSDSTKTERELGITATQWNEALVATAESYRNKK